MRLIRTDRNVTGHGVCLKVTTCSSNTGSDNDQRKEATDGTRHEQRASTNSVEQKDSGKGKDSVDDTVDTRRKKRGGVWIKTETGEDYRGQNDPSCECVAYVLVGA